jgi:hypothetical protein
MTVLPGDWEYRLESSTPLALCVSAFESLPTSVGGVPAPVSHATAAFPQPFVPARHGAVTVGCSGGWDATMTVYDLRGRSLRTLQPAAAQDGRLRFSWDGRDNHGRNVPSGVYLYTVHGASAVAASGKLTIITTEF